MKKTFLHTVDYARFVARRFVEDRCLMVAGSLTYTTLLALVPMFAVTITLTARVPLVGDPERCPDRRLVRALGVCLCAVAKSRFRQARYWV